MNRLVHHLKEHDVIAEDNNPESLKQVLLSIHDLGRHGARRSICPR